MNDKEAAKAEFEAAVSKGLDAGLVSCVWFGMVSRKKVAVLLDFVQMRGGGPAQILWQLLVSAFLVIFGGNLDKIQKNSSFFRDSFPH